MLNISITRCHIGHSIVYDTVTNLSWSVDIRKHGIVNVIDNILNTTWAPSEEMGREVPIAVLEEDCVVSSFGPTCLDIRQMLMPNL